MDELLQAVGISKKGTYSENGSYVIDIDDYDEYGKFYAILEKSQENDNLTLLDENSVINVHTTDVHYLTYDDETEDQYEISLLGNLDQNIYKLVITKF